MVILSGTWPDIYLEDNTTKVILTVTGIKFCCSALLHAVIVALCKQCVTFCPLVSGI